MSIVRHQFAPVRAVAGVLVLLITLSACADRQSLVGVVKAPSHSSDAIGDAAAYGALDYNLTSFDISTLTLIATTNLHPGDPYIPTDLYNPGDPYRTFSASFTTNTRFVLARLDLYHPGDPYCPALANDYNASVNLATSDGGLFYALIGNMAANHCNARVLVDLQSATIRSFQPVP
jgi:hypothetical protein